MMKKVKKANGNNIEPPAPQKRFGQDLTNAYFFTPKNNNQRVAVVKKIHQLKNKRSSNTNNNNITNKTTNIKTKVTEEQQPSLTMMLRKYVQLKNYNSNDKIKYEKEFQQVCKQIQIHGNIGKFPLSKIFIVSDKPMKRNKKQRLAQRKKIIMEIQGDLQIMINGRKKDDDNIRNITSTYWTTDDEGDYVYHDKTTNKVITHTEFYKRYNQYIFADRKTIKAAKALEKKEKEQEEKEEELLKTPMPKSNVNDVSIENNNNKKNDNQKNTTTLSLLDQKLIQSVKDEYHASLEDAEKDCWKVIKDAMDKYEEQCIALKANMEKQMELIHNNSNTNTTQNNHSNNNEKEETTFTTPYDETKNKMNAVITPQSSSSSLSSTSTSSSSSSTTNTFKNIKKEDNEDNDGEEEGNNTFKALAKSTLDIKKNRKKNEKLRRRSIVSLSEKKFKRRDRRKSIANNNMIKHELEDIDDSEEDNVTLGGYQHNYSSDSSDSDW